MIQACSAEHRNEALYLGCFTFVLSRIITQDRDLTSKAPQNLYFCFLEFSANYCEKEEISIASETVHQSI